MDLRGHTVEELAAAANVTVDVIHAAIKMRQKQLLLEKRSYASKLKQSIGSYVTPVTTTAKMTTRVTTTTATTTTTPRSTTPYVPKRKVSKYKIAGGHKVSELVGGS